MEGSRFGSYLKDIALFLSAPVWPQLLFNRRLPRMSQRMACLLSMKTSQPLDKTSRWVIYGNRLFTPMFWPSTRWKE